MCLGVRAVQLSRGCTAGAYACTPCAPGTYSAASGVCVCVSRCAQVSIVVCCDALILHLLGPCRRRGCEYRGKATQRHWLCSQLVNTKSY